MKRLLVLAAVLEGVTGLTLMIAPAVVTRLLLAADLSAGGAAVGRVAGCALVALGIACCSGREPASCSTPALRAMLAYNLLVTCYLTFLGIGGDLVGLLLWPAAAIHGLLTLLLVREWFKTQPTQDTKG